MSKRTVKGTSDKPAVYQATDISCVSFAKTPAEAILFLLLDIGAITIDSFFSPVQAYGRYGWRRDTAQRALLRMIAAKEIQVKNGQYIPTKTGRARAGRVLVSRFPKLQRGIWDERWRVLIFDIPEQERQVRDVLRRNIRRIGFCQLHQSVWVTPWLVPDTLLLALERLNARKYCRLLIVDHMDYDSDLLVKFRLRSSSVRISRS